MPTFVFHKVMNENTGVVKTIPQERVQNRTVEQLVGMLVSQIHEKIAEAIQLLLHVEEDSYVLYCGPSNRMENMHLSCDPSPLASWRYAKTGNPLGAGLNTESCTVMFFRGCFASSTERFPCNQREVLTVHHL